MTECGAYNTVGSRCVEPAGHTDNHRSAYGASWTDESSKRSAAWMARNMTGRD